MLVSHGHFYNKINIPAVAAGTVSSWEYDVYACAFTSGQLAAQSIGLADSRKKRKAIAVDKPVTVAVNNFESRAGDGYLYILLVALL